MPHVDIKCFPRALTDEQKTATAADITEVIIRHLQSKDSSVSVALNEVEPEAWQGVWDAEIAPQMARLIKTRLQHVRKNGRISARFRCVYGVTMLNQNSNLSI